MKAEQNETRGSEEGKNTKEQATDGAHSIIQFTVADDGV